MRVFLAVIHESIGCGESGFREEHACPTLVVEIGVAKPFRQMDFLTPSPEA
jgi:hypothetical protein